MLNAYVLLTSKLQFNCPKLLSSYLSSKFFCLMVFVCFPIGYVVSFPLSQPQIYSLNTCSSAGSLVLLELYSTAVQCFSVFRCRAEISEIILFPTAGSFYFLNLDYSLASSSRAKCSFLCFAFFSKMHWISPGFFG